MEADGVAVGPLISGSLPEVFLSSVLPVMASCFLAALAETRSFWEPWESFSEAHSRAHFSSPYSSFVSAYFNVFLLKITEVVSASST